MRILHAIHRRLLPSEASAISYLWLVYVAVFYLRYAFVDASAREVAWAVVTGVTFVALYFHGHWRRGWRLVPTIVALCVIATAWAPVNTGAGVFFIYAASFAGWLGPMRRAAGGVAAVVAWLVVVAWFVQPSLNFWIPALVFSVMIGVISIYDATRHRQDAALRLSQQEIRQLAQVAERERISRDMHDLLGHTLSVITLKAELAARLVERDPARAVDEMREVERVSRAALAEVREAVRGIRTRGLAGEIAQARIALKAAGVALAVDGDVPTLAPDKEAVLAMVVREAVTNVIRHAQATHCSIVLKRVDGECFVEVRDDGRGGVAHAGGGLDGMRARVTDAGGRLEVGDGFGTRLRAWVPA